MYLDIALSAILIGSVVFLVYELRKFGRLHARKYELPTEKIWEKFVGVRPEEMADSDLTLKLQKAHEKMGEIEGEMKKHKKLTKKLIEELGK